MGDRRMWSMRRSVHVGRRETSLCHYRLCGLLHLESRRDDRACLLGPHSNRPGAGASGVPSFHNGLSEEHKRFSQVCRRRFSTTMSSPPVVTEDAPQRIDFSCSRQTLQVNRHSAPGGTCWSIDRSCFGIQPSGKAPFCRVDGWVRLNRSRDLGEHGEAGGCCR